MVPLSWAQMQCPLTGTKEWRKVAKPADAKSNTNVKVEENQQ
jgi:exosome complex RNA-binding protein Csl4